MVVLDIILGDGNLRHARAKDQGYITNGQINRKSRLACHQRDLEQDAGDATTLGLIIGTINQFVNNFCSRTFAAKSQ